MSQVIRNLKFEVDVALIYVFKAFWREISTPTNLRHGQDSSDVKLPHLSTGIPCPVGAGVSNDWCISLLVRFSDFLFLQFSIDFKRNDSESNEHIHKAENN